jgi:hypothetical protein
VLLTVVLAAADVALFPPLGLDEQDGTVLVEALAQADGPQGPAGPVLPRGRAKTDSEVKYRRTLEQARDLAARLRFGPAIDAFNRAIRGMRQSACALGEAGFDLLLGAYVELAEAHFRKGERGHGTDAFEAALLLRPEMPAPQGERYPPVFLRALEEARTRVQGRPQGTIRIDDGGGEVSVDGIARGYAPVVVEGLVAGSHFVANGETCEVVEVRAGSAAAALQGGARVPVPELGGHAAKVQSPIALPGSQPRAVTPIASPARPVRPSPLAAELERGPVVGAGTRRPIPSGSGPLSPVDLADEVDRATPSRLWSKWWFWTAVGLGVGVAAGGTAYALQAGPPDAVDVHARW